MTTLDRQQAFTGTKEAAPALRLDTARLENYLAQHVKGFAGPLTVKQFKGGQSNPTYLLETPARRYVLAPQAARQAAAVRARGRPRISASSARSTRKAFRSPSRWCCATDEAVIGTTFYVMDFVDGRVIWEPQMPGSDAGRARRDL